MSITTETPTPTEARLEALREATLEAIPRHTRPDGVISYAALARELGEPATTIKGRVGTLARMGRLGTRPVLPGFGITSTSAQIDGDGNVQKEWITQAPMSGDAFQIPAGHVIKGVSALVDPEGNERLKWIKTKEGIDPSSVIADLETAFADFKPAAAPRELDPHEYIDQLALYPLADPHVGLYAWAPESGTNWDLKIATKTIRETIAKVIARTPQTKKAILLVGGDTLHADNNSNMTAKSGNTLQVDGRYPKVMLAACEMIVASVDMMLSRHAEVEVIVIPGNHDEHSSYAIAFFLHAWFRNEPRVSVDKSPSLFRYREFGKVMLGTTHGHAAKINAMPGIMAAREPEMWGRTKFRYVHGFHVHHSSVRIGEGGGCTTETHQIIAPQDSWHFGEGFLSGRSFQSILYDREHGEVGRSRVAVH